MIQGNQGQLTGKQDSSLSAIQEKARIGLG